VDRDLKSFEESMKMVVGFVDCPLDCRFTQIRTEGTNASEFIADIARIAADADICILNSGTLRIDSIISEGPIRLQEIFGMLPFIDPVVKIELTGKQLLQALENGVSQYPAYEGRFPMLSGVSFSYDPKKPKHERVILDSVKIEEAPLELEMTYTLATKWFLAEGKDGYDVFENCKKLTSEETAPGLRQDLLEFFQLTNNADYMKFLESVKPGFQHKDSLLTAPSFQRKESQGYKKKREKFAKWSQMVSGITEKDGKTYVHIAPKNNNRIKRIA
jgi:5'-nucleotidase